MLRDNKRGDDDGKVESLTYKVPINHFNFNDDEEITIHYFINDEYFDKTDVKSPVIVLLGGEGPLDGSRLLDRYAFSNMAKEMKALQVAIEHRYYGDSTPSLELKSLVHCTAEQAMMDFVEIITHVKESKEIQDHPVIVVGGSYSGNLAAWMRQKYPNLVDAAWASSAPVEAKVDYHEYLEVMQSDLPKNTADLLESAFNNWDKMTETESGRKKLDEIFTTCSPLQGNDLQTFEESIGTALAGLAQYNSSIWAEGYQSVDDACYDFMNDIANNYPKFVLSQFGECVPTNTTQSYQDLMNTKTYSQGNGEASGRSWMFQTCVAYGYYQAVSDESSVKFGKLNELEGSIKMCKEVYDIDKDTLYDAVRMINNRYGARKPCVTNVAFTNGKTDSWHALGITEQEGQDGCLVQVIDGTSHCSDLYKERSTDVPSLKQARHKEIRFFEEIIKNLP